MAGVRSGGVGKARKVGPVRKTATKRRTAANRSASPTREAFASDSSPELGPTPTKITRVAVQARKKKLMNKTKARPAHKAIARTTPLQPRK